MHFDISTYSARKGPRYSPGIVIGATLRTSLLFRLLRFCLLLFVLCFWLSGCASFAGKDLPGYTYADLAPAPEKKSCLVIADNVEKNERKTIDATIAILEKSGFFQKAPERRTPGGAEIQNSIKVNFRNDLKFGNMTVAFISGFVSGATLMIFPGYARDEFVLKVQLTRKGDLVKEYAYREHVDTWIHLSMLFMMSKHTPRAAMHEIYERMIMHFLYDYSRDVQQGIFETF